ncbi:MAG: hypothetical protein KGJ11_07835, partial [Candidatus Omnitrophica bacterium]|nr:hypothetical protein [Candidatus Omnitrophota bacterium]
EKQQEVLARETNNLPSNRQAIGAVAPILRDFAKGMEESTHPNIWPLNEDPTVSEAFDRGLQAILIGDKTPQQVAREVQKVKDEQMAKHNRRR